MFRCQQPYQGKGQAVGDSGPHFCACSSIFFPTSNGGMQNGSSIEICTQCTHIFARLAADSHAQSGLVGKISATDLMRKFIKSALLVGYSSKAKKKNAYLVFKPSPLLVGLDGKCLAGRCYWTLEGQSPCGCFKYNFFHMERHHASVLHTHTHSAGCPQPTKTDKPKLGARFELSLCFACTSMMVK